MYGWRGRLGIIVPSVNYVMEPEFNSVLPDGISCHASRVFVGGEKYGLSSLVDMADNTGRATEELNTVADVVGYGCTSGSFAKGAGWDKEIIKRMNEKAPGIPATTTSTALINALLTLEVKKISLATPYTEEVTMQMKDFFHDQGFEVVDFRFLSVSKHGGQGDYYPPKAYTLAKDVFNASNKIADAVVISCTNFRTFEIIEPLEKDLGVPVITSNQATLWEMLKMIDINRNEIDGLGKLMSEY